MKTRPWPHTVEHGRPEGLGDQSDLEPIVAEVSYRQRNAMNANAALDGDLPCLFPGQRKPPTGKWPLWAYGDESYHGIDVTLNKMPAETVAEAKRPFQIQSIPWAQLAKERSRDRFG
jgi:hypothetical protein